MLGTVGNKRGSLAWRCTTNAHTGHWILYAVSEQRHFSFNSYGNESVWGIAGSGQVYRNGVCTLGNTNNFMGEQSIDVMVNSDEGWLKFYTHAHDEVFELTGLSPGITWYPHFNLFNRGTVLKVEYIALHRFGKKIEKSKFSQTKSNFGKTIF